MDRSRRYATLALAMVCSLSTAGVARAAQTPVTWLGIALGSPVSSVRAIIGDPQRILTFHDGAVRIGRYAMAGQPETIFVIEGRGYVTGISAFYSATPPATASGEPDPNGVRLGDTSDSVTARHLEAHSGVDDRGEATLVGHVSATVGFTYSFHAGKVSYIQWGTIGTESLPELAALTLPAGDSTATAIDVVASNETDGVSWEYRFLGFHPCDGDTAWKLSQQSLLHEGARSYDRLHVTCPTTKSERDFYFDITSYFGKM